MHNGAELELSHHAYDRMEERIGYNTEVISNKIKEILNFGIETDLKMNWTPHKERIIAYQDYCLHIRENTIVTIKYNQEFFGIIRNRGKRSLNRTGKYK
jgi:hypothetical protein